MFRSLKFWPNQWLYLAFFVASVDIMMTVRKFYFINVICSGAFAIIFADICVMAYEFFVYKRKFIEDVKTKAVLVTGCGSGIGFQIAQRLAKMGYLVYAGVHNIGCDGAKTLQTVDNIVVLSLDVTDQTSVDTVVAFVKADLKKRGDRTFWSLVNNAGVAIYSNVESASMEHYQKHMDVNAFGVVRMCKSFLPLLRGAGEGRIVNISSLSGHTTLPYITGYSMSKYALESFANGLRIELKPWNISVHNISPSYYQTTVVLQERVDKFRAGFMKEWQQCPTEVKESYGKSYIDEITKSFYAFALRLLNPLEKLPEVIDDVAHAVGGIDPKVQYIPGIKAQIGVKILGFLPQEVADHFLGPKVKELPAALKAKKQS